MKQTLIITALICLIVMAACNKEDKTQSVKSLLNYETKDIYKITILDGTTGHKKVITDQTQIESFLFSLENIEIKISENQEVKEGYLYSVKLYGYSAEYKFTNSNIGNKYIESKELLSLLDKLYNLVE